MHLFYSPVISGTIHILPKDESRHCIKVLRLKTGEKVHLTDGLGNLYETVIIDDNFEKCELKIKNIISEFGKRNFNLHLAVAPTKNIHRFEWLLEKTTEIGIDIITPICEHSERKSLHNDRQNKVITSAMKQSLKAYHPILNDFSSFQKFIQQDFFSQKFIAYISETYKDSLKYLYRPGENAIIMIGPEGDFSGKEIEHAMKKGFIPVSLGPSRLRTETAALAACLTINLMNQ
jgi:16S rRNA (uracil1498-N3)-methyltransferase